MTVKVVWPSGNMALLSQLEADSISLTSQGELYNLYRNCSLAVLNSGALTDNSKELLDNYESFEIDVMRNERGLKIELINPPQSAIVDDEIIQSLQKHLYAVLRDIVQMQYLHAMDRGNSSNNLLSIPDFIFKILRNADVLEANKKPSLAVCWGGHSISESEYDYAYNVGYALGLRGVDICTGCGPGVMEAPMKGSLMGFNMQNNVRKCRRIGLTEPSIIAAEPPNPMVSDLVIMPDIEKRLEAFVRLGHVLIVFPGGPGTAEELLYIIGIKLLSDNRHTALPLILTGNKESKAYFDAIDEFLRHCFGNEVTRHYKIIIDDPQAVAVEVKEALDTVYNHRIYSHDSFCYNWSLKIPTELQSPFDVTHENMASLDLHRDQEPWLLAANLRRAFSGIVTGNVKDYGIQQVAQKGPFTLHGDEDIVGYMDKLMRDFIAQKRISLSDKEYIPCYKFKKAKDK